MRGPPHQVVRDSYACSALELHLAAGELPEVLDVDLAAGELPEVGPSRPGHARIPAELVAAAIAELGIGFNAPIPRAYWCTAVRPSVW